MPMRPAVTLALLCVAAGAPRVFAAEPASKLDFARDIRPILSDKCFTCHGPDARERKGKLRLDTHDGALAKAKSGKPAVVPGKPDESELVRRIFTIDDDDLMPPKESHRTLSADQKQKLRDWIAQGANYDQHWAFVTPKKPAIPAVKNAAWVRNEIDAFVLAKLEKLGLRPMGEADRRTLIRRLSFDLTGLPPTPQEVEAFVNDARADAYDRLVDRLLESPRYGEHRARYWLDAARYGDTHGLHLDNYREFWLYRQWVINAFNRNMPFDQFTIEQLAGDMLPSATVDQQVASGFNRAHVTTSEGGSIAEEVYVRNVVDRVETTGTVFLGLTLGCAVCHDHKFDPITMRDFYGMFAIFNSLDENPLDGNAAAHPPVIRVGSDEQLKQLAEAKAKLAASEKALVTALAEIDYTDPGPDAKTPPPKNVEVVFVEDESPSQAELFGNWRWVEKREGATEPVFSGSRARKATEDGLGQHFFQGLNPPVKVDAGDVFFAYVYIDPANPPQAIMLQFNDGNWEHRAYWGENIIQWGTDRSPSRQRAGDLPKPGEWVRLEIAASRVGITERAAVRGMAFTQFGGTVYWDKAGVVHRGQKTWLSLEAWLADPKKNTGLPKDVLAAVRAGADRNDAQKKIVRDYFLTYVYPETREALAKLTQPVTAAEKKIELLEKSMPSTLVSREIDTPKPAYILMRGEYDKKGDQVPRSTPAALPPLKPGMPLNRLGFAQWLVDRDHPLMARVTVNRFWEQLFGVGLVKTSEDFGSQGEIPIHAELLDWLAVQFQDDRWDVKHFLRRIVSSSTYRQASNVSPQLAERDPENRLLARGPRFRLDAEALRDQALYLGGLLVERVGGPSVKVPQPEGLWEAVGYSSSNTARFVADRGVEKVHRRSVYTFWKRTSAPPQMTTFDAPSRESCVVRRERTNTPLQALLMMNEPQYFEAARAFAQRAMREGGQTAEQRVRWAFTAATGRAPDALEAAELLTAYRDSLHAFTADPDKAAKLIAVGETRPDPTLDPKELAAWTMIGNVLLNLDEVISKG